MRGIPSSFLVFFFASIFFIELISYFGIRVLLNKHSKSIRINLSILYLLISLLSTGLLLYSFANPEVIRQTRNYGLFFFVISFTLLNLVPKFVFTSSTLISFFLRLFAGQRVQIIVLTGSFVICTGLFTAISYGIFLGRYNLNVERQDLYFDHWPEQLDGFRIVQLSDSHLGSFGNRTDLLKETVQIIEQINPDLLLFTGDLVNNFSEETVKFEPFLNQLPAKYGKYAIQGNHDYGDYSNWTDSTSKKKNLHQIKASLTNSGFRLLLNQWEKIVVKDTSFALIGVENWGHKPFPQYANLNSAMKGIPESSFKVLMSHDPEHWNSIIVPQTDISLTLSGHTHGGQFGLKIAGIEFSPIYFIQKYWGGLYRSNNQLLYVNRGLGTVGFPGRIEMRPEITVLTLYQTKNH